MSLFSNPALRARDNIRRELDRDGKSSEKQRSLERPGLNQNISSFSGAFSVQLAKVAAHDSWWVTQRKSQDRTCKRMTKRRKRKERKNSPILSSSSSVSDERDGVFYSMAGHVRNTWYSVSVKQARYLELKLKSAVQTPPLHSPLTNLGSFFLALHLFLFVFFNFLIQLPLEPPTTMCHSSDIIMGVVKQGRRISLL